MIAEIPSHAQVADSASKNKVQRIELDGKLLSIVINNNENSTGALWIGVNTERPMEPIQPGQSYPIAVTRESSYLRGFIVLAWDDATTADGKIGFIVRQKAGEEITDC